LAGQLLNARDGLDEFSCPDVATDVRAVLSLSYRTLSDPAARLFRLWGVLPSPDASVDALASLGGIPVKQVRPLLDELTTANMIDEHATDRWTLHDLLRAYTIELVHGVEDKAERRRALRRVLDHYLHAAHHAAMLIEPQREPIPLESCDPAVSVRLASDRDQALTWFTLEYAGVLAAIECAGGETFDTCTWQLAWTLADFQQWRCLWLDRAASLLSALEAARRLDHRAEQARAHRGLGYAYTRLARNDDAHVHFRHALNLYTELGDPIGQGRAHHGLSYVLERQGNMLAALRHADKALSLYPHDYNAAQRARALGTVGWCHSQLGNYEKALRYSQQALVLVAGTGDGVAEAAIWDSLGYAHHHLGHHDRAIDSHETALRLRRELGHRYGEANTLTHLGDTHQVVGDIRAARHAWQDALTLLEQLGEPDADQLRRKLDQVSSGPR